MKRRNALALCMAAALTLLATGCAKTRALFGEEDNSEPPAELVEFEPQVKVTTLWSKRVGSGAGKQRVKLTPAIYEGRVFAADRKGRVEAYDADTGETIWKAPTDVPVSGGPGVGDNLVLVGSSEGDVVALDPDSGDVVWRTRVSSEVLAPPQAADGVVVVRTVDGKLYGLESTGGTRLWVYDRTVPVLTLRGTSTPVLAGDLVIAGFDSGRLVAVTLRSGQAVWETRIVLPHGRSELERLVDIDSEPMIAGNTVYVVTFQGRVAAVDIDSGDILWRRDMSSHAGLGVDTVNLYVSDEESHIWALDRHSSASLWRQQKLHARNITSPTAFQDYVVVGDLEGYVHWMRRDDGQFVARVRVDDEGIVVAPVASGDTLYVYDNSGTLAALRVE